MEISDFLDNPRNVSQCCIEVADPSAVGGTKEEVLGVMAWYWADTCSCQFSAMNLTLLLADIICC